MTNDQAIQFAQEELMQMQRQYGSFRDLYAAHAALMTEVTHLTIAIVEDRVPQRVTREAIQVAAMALQLLVDWCAVPTASAPPEATCSTMPSD